MTLGADQIYSLLPAIYRTRDAAAGEPLKALLAVIAEQVGVLEENLRDLYDDEFIETCAPWVVPYIGDLIGWTPLLAGPGGVAGSRAEVANTIGYRRRKGTVIALEQLGADVTGRSVHVVEYFRRLAVNQSMHHLRPDAGGYADLRNGRALLQLGGPFETSSRTVDVRRIAPRSRTPADPDAAPLDVLLHGEGRFSIPDIGAWVWRWISYAVTGQPAAMVDARRFMFSPLGADMPLFNQPTLRQPFDHLTARADVSQPIGRREFHDSPQSFYGPDQGLLVTADGVPVDVSGICVCDLSDVTLSGQWPSGPAGKVAIDPVLGRIAFPLDRPAPSRVSVDYRYGFPADLGGGPYDRTRLLPLNRAAVTWQRVIGTGVTDIFGLPATVEGAVAAFNAQPPGTIGVIVLAGFGVADIGLTGAAAIAVPPGSQLWIVAAEIIGVDQSDSADWSPIRARYVLHGDIDVVAADGALNPAVNEPDGQVFLSGVLLAGGIRVVGSAINLGLQDCTLVPGRELTRDGKPVDCYAPSVAIGTGGATLMLERAITGPLRVDAAASVRITDSFLDATEDWHAAFAGEDGASEGGTLQIENSTVIGKVWTHLLPLASNTIFLARRSPRDFWDAAIWCTRRQSGCVRFCSVPTDALTPRQYRCLPGDQSLENALAPRFITLQYGRPSYGLLSGDCPVAVWQGADDGSQIGAYHLLFETQALANYSTRLGEYLPFNLEAGIFLLPSRPEPLPPTRLGYGIAPPRTAWIGDEPDPLQWFAIGAGLI